MKFLIILSSIISPIVFVYLHSINKKTGTVLNGIAFIAALVFGIISALSIYQIIIDNTVFMTAIHGIFLNPFFLITGAYLGVYILYRLILITIDEM